MQIVINLSDSIYDAIKNKYTLVNPKEGTLVKTLWDAIENGTPLPKGHGRIVDISKIEYLRSVYDAIHEHITWQEAIKRIKESAPTIIEADKAESEVEK